MTFICKICESEPGSHSFSKIREEDNISVFYTCPSKSIKYNDHDGIISHYKGIMDEHGDKPWIWIFDSVNFSIKHAMEIKISIRLLPLLFRCVTMQSDCLRWQWILSTPKTWTCKRFAVCGELTRYCLRQMLPMPIWKERKRLWLQM